MALNRTTEWICDICAKRETVNSNSYHKGLNTPKSWDEVYVTMKQAATVRYERHILACDNCINGFKSTNSYLEEDKKEFKKTFWQKIFGRNEA